MKIPTETDVSNAQYKQVSDTDWLERKKDFMLIECGQPTVATRANLFIGEINEIQSPLTPTVRFQILVRIVNQCSCS